MKIECPSCHLTGNFNDRDIPPGGRNIACPRCRTSFPVARPAQEAGGNYLVDTCPSCQYSTFTEEQFPVCPKCGISIRDFHEKRRKQQETEQARAGLEAAQQSYRNPDIVKTTLEEPDAVEQEQPQPVRITGWLAVLAGCAMLSYGGYGLYDYYTRDWRAVLSEQLLEPLSRFEVFLRMGFIPWMATIFSIILVIVGSQFANGRGWAMKWLTGCAWGGLVFGIIHELGGFIGWVRVSSSTVSVSYYFVGIITALFMLALWWAPFILLLWVLRQDWIADEFPE